jgi:type IV pilus assembly protein PilZ
MDRVPLVFPVRFAAAQIAVQTTTRELSTDGVYVRCLQPPAETSLVSLKLYLPGGREPVETQGSVHEVSASADAGFWAKFIQLADQDRQQIAEVIERRQRASQAKPIGAMRLQPAGEDPRRTFPRVNARFAVRFATVQDFVLEYAANISAGGIFVETQNPPPLKTVVRVEMELPGGAAVPAQGLVVHRVTPDDANKRGTAPGMGVQFIDANDAFRQRIDAAIDHILRNGA